MQKLSDAQYSELFQRLGVENIYDAAAKMYEMVTPDLDEDARRVISSASTWMQGQTSLMTALYHSAELMFGAGRKEIVVKRALEILDENAFYTVSVVPSSGFGFASPEVAQVFAENLAYCIADFYVQSVKSSSIIEANCMHGSIVEVELEKVTGNLLPAPETISRQVFIVLDKNSGEWREEAPQN